MLAVVSLFVVAVTLKWTNTAGTHTEPPHLMQHVDVVSALRSLVQQNSSAIPVSRCPQSDYICEGLCPDLPFGAELPAEDDQNGLCFKHTETDACVCWLRNSDQHLQTLFKCEVAANNTIKHVMCLPPPICFPPGTDLGCMIVLKCPCVDFGRGAHFDKWRSGVAFILRSKTPVPVLTSSKEGTATSDVEQSSEDTREFSVKHLLFLLAFVIAPLLCWCLLTFFHEGKCRKKRSSPETEPMPTERVEEVEESCNPCPTVEPCIVPTAPKMESPPPYREVIEPGESCLMAADCGPPPPYEDAVRDQQWRIEEVDSE